MSLKHALLVGIDRYPHYTGAQSCDLKGCVNDSHLVKNLLLDQFGFEGENVEQLLNEGATRKAILDALDALVAKVGQNDVVLFHYSGHGRHRYPPSQDLDEGTGHNSTLMPTDSGPAPVPNQDINDDEIQAWLQKLTQKTCNVTLIIDSCHSGTISRDAFGPKIRTTLADVREVAEPPRKSDDAVATPAQTKGGSGWLELSDRYVVISACADVDVASELVLTDSAGVLRNHGALTHYLVDALKSAPEGSTYRDVFEIAQRNVTRFAAGLSPPRIQHPQVEGTLDRELFGYQDIEPLRSIIVEAVAGDSVVLGGGAAHGIRLNSQWAVYPPGTKSADEAVPVGMLHVHEVNALQANARTASTTMEVVIGSRCVLQQHALDPTLVPVAATPDDAQDAVQTISRADGQWRAWPTLPSEIDVSLMINGHVHAVSDGALTEDLEKVARFRDSLLLANPADSVAVAFELMRVSEQGSAVAVGEGIPLFKQGEKLAFKVTNNEPCALFFSIMHLRLTGEVQLMYPPNAFSERIEPGITVLLGVDRTLQLAMDYPNRDYGFETFKLMVTTRQSQFSWLEQARPVAELRWGPQPPEPSAGQGLELPPSVKNDTEQWQAFNRTIMLERQN